jgi:DNA-binding MarR family transcriptional regulator
MYCARKEVSMPEVLRGQEVENERIVLGLLESVERDGAQSQRKLAAELGIALGLVNAYLRRCVIKGLVKMSEVPARRYAYYLTPKGFAEKSRLTVDYLASSFEFFRRARADCSDVLMAANARGWQRVALLGVSDLAEIATICALETGTTIAAVVDPRSTLKGFVGIPVLSSLDEIRNQADCVVVTDLKTAHETTKTAIEKFGLDRVLVPTLLGVRIHENRGVSE